MGAVDGPGLRCVVFMQGCPLRCAYCHNPETWDLQGGEDVSLEELVSKIDRFRPYIIKNGGVTISGGEPLLQHEFVTKLLQVLKEKGYHTAIDTSGIGSLQDAAKILAFTDLAIVDLKFTDKDKFQTYCKGDLEQVYDFLALTEKLRIPIWIRQVIIPGVNDSEEDLAELKRITSLYSNFEKLELLPFSKLCENKYEELGIPFPLKDTPECSKEHLESLLKYV